MYSCGLLGSFWFSAGSFSALLKMWTPSGSVALTTSTWKQPGEAPLGWTQPRPPRLDIAMTEFPLIQSGATSVVVSLIGSLASGAHTSIVADGSKPLTSGALALLTNTPLEAGLSSVPRIAIP